MRTVGRGGMARQPVMVCPCSLASDPATVMSGPAFELPLPRLEGVLEVLDSRLHPRRASDLVVNEDPQGRHRQRELGKQSSQLGKVRSDEARQEADPEARRGCHCQMGNRVCAVDSAGLLQQSLERGRDGLELAVSCDQGVPEQITGSSRPTVAFEIGLGCVESSAKLPDRPGNNIRIMGLVSADTDRDVRLALRQRESCVADHDLGTDRGVYLAEVEQDVRQEV